MSSLAIHDDSRILWTFDGSRAIIMASSFSGAEGSCTMNTLRSWGAILCVLLAVENLNAQPALPQQGNQGQASQGLGNIGFFGGPGQVGLGPGAPGGAANADFDSLIDLIQSTVEYDTWMENGTGEGEIQPFPMGVYADPEGTLRFDRSQLTTVGLKRAPKNVTTGDVRQSSSLRYVSLPQLERAIAKHQAEHQPLPPEILTLAGLQRVQYVLINPKTSDLILAGPAGDWQVDPSGIIVSTETGRPVVRLDDLLTLWRRRNTSTAFGCSITPRQQALAKTQEYLSRTSQKPIEPSDRKDWLTGLRDSLGKQDVEFFGTSPDSHVALVLLVADYHMKLIGMGLADGVNGVSSYLDTVELDPSGSAPPLSVLRWWFALTERPLKADTARQTFEIPAGGVRVLSENELLAARGARIHTHQSDDLNRRFAQSFTEHFAQIADKYPLYGELQHIFDLAVVITLIEREQLVGRSGWQPAMFEDPRLLRLPRMAVPREVETVINHRVIKRKQIIAGISGGVWVDAPKHLKLITDEKIATGLKDKMPSERWWWD